MSKVEPVNGWVSVEPVEASDKVGSLIVVTRNESYKRGRILALPCELDPKVKYLRIGNIVVYDALGAVSVRVGDGTAHLVKSNEILCVLRDDEPA